MKYNPDIHHRRSIRLRGYDYSREGAYFITICAQNRQCIFGHIENNTMMLNAFGQIAYWEWEKLPQRWPHIELGAFQIMPNHMHGIIIVNDVPVVGAPLAGAPTRTNTNMNTNMNINMNINTDANMNINAPTHADADRAPARGAPTGTPTAIQWAQKPTIGQIVGAYKSRVATECLKQAVAENTGLYLGKIWQRNFWENIIRDLNAFDKISNYIILNPANWKKDKFFGRK